MNRPTSVEAFNAVMQSGHVTERQREVYRVLHKVGPCTARTLNEIAGDGAWKRLSEMQRRGLVEEAGETRCPHTRKTVILWRVTDALPGSPQEPQARRAGVLAALRAENRRLKTMLEQAQRRLARWGRPSDRRRAERDADGTAMLFAMQDELRDRL